MTLPPGRGAALAFVLATAWIVVLGESFRGDARDGVYFHEWTSEYMMQTLPLGDLRHEPLRSLWYNHIQPPLLDAIRAAIAALYPRAGPEALMRAVDLGLQRVLALVYGATAAIVFLWIRRLAGGRAAAIATGVFALLPGPIFYAFYLDSTSLSALWILWFHFELWRLLRPGSTARGGRLVLAGVLLVVTRSVFQWPFLVVVASGAALMARTRVDRKRAVFALAPLGAFMALYLLKQYLLFGLTITSSFGPDSFCKGLSEYCHGTLRVEIPPLTDPFNATVLRRAEKLNGEYNYNQVAFLRRSFSQMAEYRAHLRRLTPARVARILGTNLSFYLRPTSRHSNHAIVDRLPWRSAAERLFSGAGFVGGLAVAATLWFRRTGRLDRAERRSARLFGLGLALPVLYVAAVTVVFESGENMRYRFFLEPTLFVFVAAQAGAALRGSGATRD